jgi:hypothetical protein
MEIALNVTNHPLLVLTLSFAALWLAAWVGFSFLRRRLTLKEEVREEFGLILGASLTLPGLLIGFSFSMATTRYDRLICL